MRQVELPPELAVKGSLFLSSLPGRHESIEDAMDAWQAQSIDLIVSLVGPYEIRDKAPSYGQAIAQGLIEPERLEYPVKDFGVPGEPDHFARFLQSIARRLREGERVLIHCAGGIGRTGTAAAIVLCVLGLDVESSLHIIKQAGSGPETSDQRALCRQIAADLERGGP